MTLRSKSMRLVRLEELAAPRGVCRRPLVLGPPEIFPGQRAAV